MKNESTEEQQLQRTSKLIYPAFLCELLVKEQHCSSFHNDVIKILIILLGIGLQSLFISCGCFHCCGCSPRVTLAKKRTFPQHCKQSVWGRNGEGRVLR